MRCNLVINQSERAGVLLVGGKQQEEDFASKADLLPPGRLWAEREREIEREGERAEEGVGRKIIDPPNMGTKSDPKIKNTQSSKG
jgi:hypothetical protein